jgi:hypothetical protein
VEVTSPLMQPFLQEGLTTTAVKLCQARRGQSKLQEKALNRNTFSGRGAFIMAFSLFSTNVDRFYQLRGHNTFSN